MSESQTKEMVDSEEVVLTDDDDDASDSEVEYKKFGSRSKKRKLDSDSDVEYVPPSEAEGKKVKKEKPKPSSPAKKPRKRETVPKEKKPKPERKRAVRKTKGTIPDDNCEGSSEVTPGTSESSSNIQPSEGKSKPFNSKNLERMDWSEAELVAAEQQIEIQIACNIIRLLDEDNTIPFIARYRKELTNDMSPEKLRDVKASYDIVKSVKQKAATVMNSIAKLGKMTPLIEMSIRCARSLSELEHIYSPFKPGSKHTLAERARQLGLDEPANAVLTGSSFVSLERLIDPSKKGLDNLKDVELGLQHIIADVISKDKDVLDLIRKLKEDAHIKIETSKARETKTTKQKAKAEEQKNAKKAGDNKGHKDKVDNESKFENYFNFSIPVKFIKPHQVLAVNRGESLKVLSVKVNVPEWVLHRLKDFCFRQWMSKGAYYPLRTKLVTQSINDSYTRLIQPLIVRQVRAELTQKAEHAAVEVFATNLKKLLLSPPLRGKIVLGIDPGYRNGCKLGVTSATGSVLATDVMYPQFGKRVDPYSDHNAQKLKDLLTKHSCEIIALGNGTACRETESYLSELIQSGWFRPLDVKFTIVSEQGASIYSCSPIAKKEFPNLDPNSISAVSLARRLQDPLGELVKVEPKHLGVGMYQHDVPEKQLSSTLDEIVIECVSFVGVDVNIASDCLLRRIAGLNSARADKIIQWRTTNGPFTNRKQLKDVKGIGAKTFEQCAGFIRVMPETARKTEPNAPKRLKLDTAAENPLDRTWIHPESYEVALRFVRKCDVDLQDLGQPAFIRTVATTVDKIGLKNLAEQLGIAEATMKLIAEGLQQSPDHDLRSQFQEPLFRRGVTSLDDIQTGAVLTGRAQNVTHFGTFVDIGVGQDGLIPASRLRNIRPQLGDKIEVKVFSVDLNRRRITLDLLRIL